MDKQPDLFGDEPKLPQDVVMLTGLAKDIDFELLNEIEKIIKSAPLRQMLTPYGKKMSVAMTNCGSLGWTSDSHGYRYSSLDPLTRQPWPPMPQLFLSLARKAAVLAGYQEFRPDACLINQYLPGSKMTLHQDKDEKDFTAPIVSVSLGLSATFKLGGNSRSDQLFCYQLNHGDVIVWGKTARLAYHEILTLKPGYHQLVGGRRINLTFRKAN